MLSGARGFWQEVVRGVGMGSGDTDCYHSSGQHALGWGWRFFFSFAVDLADLEGRTHGLGVSRFPLIENIPSKNKVNVFQGLQLASSYQQTRVQRPALLLTDSG